MEVQETNQPIVDGGQAVGPVEPANTNVVQAGPVVSTGPTAEVDPGSRPAFSQADADELARYRSGNVDVVESRTGTDHPVSNPFERDDETGEFVGPWRHSVIATGVRPDGSFGATEYLVSNDRTDVTFRAGSVDDAETTIRDNYTPKR